jgi:tetratricopeptide (TPR) repeat protein
VKKTFFYATLFATILVWASTAHAAVTSELQGIHALFKQGQYAQALEQDNAYIEKNPTDAQALFLKGLILTSQNKPLEAISVFTGLTENFPELSEPYNNLAVLYAAQGDYDKARNALEIAIHIQPDYAVAYTNLGDLNAKMAAIAYHKALQLDPNNIPLHTKLSFIDSLLDPNAKPCPESTRRNVPVNSIAPVVTPSVTMPAPHSMATPTPSVQGTAF